MSILAIACCSILISSTAAHAIGLELDVQSEEIHDGLDDVRNALCEPVPDPNNVANAVSALDDFASGHHPPAAAYNVGEQMIDQVNQGENCASVPENAIPCPYCMCRTRCCLIGGRIVSC